jgi:hypothetical protein
MGRATRITSTRLTALVNLSIMIERQRMMRVVPIDGITEDDTRESLGLGDCKSIYEQEKKDI